MNAAAAAITHNDEPSIVDRKPPRSAPVNWTPRTQEESSPPQFGQNQASTVAPGQDRLLNAREVAARLGVSERWVRDHTTRRSPKLRGVKLGTLMRYRRADVEAFMERLTTSRASLQPRFGG